MPDLVARLAGGPSQEPWHRVIAHDRGATFETRCGEVLWPADGYEGMKVSTREQLMRMADDAGSGWPRCVACLSEPGPTLRRFALVRRSDPTGVSGIGRVAEGVRFSDGTCVLRWLTSATSTAVYGNIDDVVAIHGHEGATTVEWLDP